MAEWLGTGLQNQLQRFESARDLQALQALDFQGLFYFLHGFGFLVSIAIIHQNHLYYIYI